MNFRFLSYSLNDLAANREIRGPEFHMSADAKKRAYPIRALRYWWVGQVIERELAGRAGVTIVDMGAGHGQMRRYCAGSFADCGYQSDAMHWIGLDKDTSNVAQAPGYEKIIECDFDQPLPLESGSANLLISIHVMEHLPRPEFTMSEIARVLAPGGVFCGGSPTAPGFVSYFLHRRLQRKMRQGTTGPNGHINSLSPGDWKRLVAQAGLQLDFITGSHFMRVSGSVLEDSKTWAASNLLWGSLFPSLGSEVYLLARKRK